MSRNATIYFILCGIGVLIGISNCIYFFIVHGNSQVGFWSILSGIIAAVCFHLRWVKEKGTLGRWHTKTTLNYLNFIGFLAALSGFAALIWYLFLTFYYHIPIYPLSKSTAIASIYAMICGKWGVLLTYHSNKYELTVIIYEQTPILTESIA